MRKILSAISWNLLDKIYLIAIDIVVIDTSNVITNVIVLMLKLLSPYCSGLLEFTMIQDVVLEWIGYDNNIYSGYPIQYLMVNVILQGLRFVLSQYKGYICSGIH